MAIKEGLYQRDGLSDLEVENHFFDVRDIYSRMLEMGIGDEFKTMLEADFVSSVVEDLFMEGEIGLEFFASDK